MIITKGKNIFQKNIKEKEDIKNHITALAANWRWRDNRLKKEKKKTKKKVYYGGDVDGDANEVYTYYNPTSPADNDDDDDNVHNNEKATVYCRKNNSKTD